MRKGLWFRFSRPLGNKFLMAAPMAAPVTSVGLPAFLPGGIYSPRVGTLQGGFPQQQPAAVAVRF
jgi:hypothetical protein